MEEDSEIRISYETLFELLVRERSRAELQKLPLAFFDNVVIYLKQKEDSVREKQGQLDFEGIKIKKEIENIKQIARDLYNKREKKIVNLALDKSKTQSSIIDINLLLKEEKELFDELVNSLDRKRKYIIDILNGVKSAKEDKPIEEVAKNENPPDMAKQEGSKTTKLVRFVHAVPKFLGLEGEEYGPFEEEDVASLPSEIVDLLIKKERVEEMEQS